MNEKESNQIESKNDVSVKLIPTETSSFDVNKVVETGINFLDTLVNKIEKDAKNQLKYSQETIPENNQKVSKPKRKIEKEIYTEKSLEKTEEPLEFDTTTLKEQYGFYGEMIITLVNPFISKEGIEPITKEELQDLINAIFDLIGKYMKQMGTSVQTSLSAMKYMRKWIALVKAFSAILVPRIEAIQKIATKARAKKVVNEINKTT